MLVGMRPGLRGARVPVADRVPPHPVGSPPLAAAHCVTSHHITAVFSGVTSRHGTAVCSRVAQRGACYKPWSCLRSGTTRHGGAASN